VWIARGLPSGLAHKVANVLRENPEEALRIHIREELGVDPDSRPSPWLAAISSFVCFAIGAFVPLVSYLLGGDSLWVALGIGGVGLFVAGALTSRFTGRFWLLSGLRQLALGGAAAVATYAIGSMIGVTTM
jgi:VIT1/CCC1 family predicted Fe2+/Mn2+ transporter